MPKHIGVIHYDAQRAADYDFKVGDDGLSMAYILSRRSNPETSKNAARKLVQSGAHQTACERVHAALVEFKHGASANELADATGMLVHVVLKRLPDLMKKGLADKTDKVRENQTVWKAV